MNFILNCTFNQIGLMIIYLFIMLINVNAYVIGNKLSKAAGNTGQSNIAYSQDNKGSYQFAYEVTDKGGATNFRQETGGPKAVKGSYGLTDVDGRTRLVNYQADKYGFVATVDTNEPGTGREDSANAAFNGPDKGKGWAYAVAINDNQIGKTNKKYDGSAYQSYSYSSNFDDKFGHQPNHNDDSYNEKNYDRRDEYKNPVESPKPILNEKISTDNQVNSKKDDQIKNVNYESGGHFDTSGVSPSSISLSNNESDKNYDQSKTQQEDNSDNLDDTSAEDHYDKRQMHSISQQKENDRSTDYLNTLDKKEKIKSSSSQSNSKKSSSSSSSLSSLSSSLSSTTSNIKNDKVISKLIKLSSRFDDGDTSLKSHWTNPNIH